MMMLHWIDYGMLGIVIISMLIGVFRGLVRETLSLVGLGVSVMLALYFMDRVDPLLQDFISQLTIRAVVAFAAILIVCLFLFALFNHLLGKIIIKVGLGGIDRFLGLFFGFARGILVIALVMLLMERVDPAYLKQEPWTKVYFLPHFAPLLEWLHGLPTEDMGQYFKPYLEQFKIESSMPAPELDTGLTPHTETIEAPGTVVPEASIPSEISTDSLPVTESTVQEKTSEN